MQIFRLYFLIWSNLLTFLFVLKVQKVYLTTYCVRKHNGISSIKGWHHHWQYYGRENAKIKE